MKKAVILFSIFFIFAVLNPVIAYEDREVTAQNYNKQGALALSHALKANGGEKRYFLKEAKWFYEKSVNTYPNNLDGFMGLAKTYMYLGRFKKAYDNLMVAYNFDDKNPMIIYYIAENSFLQEKYFTALTYYKEATKFGYSNHYDTNYKIALCYDKLGDAKNAIKYFNRCIEINPNAKIPKDKIEEIENSSANHKNYYGK